MAFPVCHLCSLVFAHSLLWTCAAAAGDCKIIFANLNNPNARHIRRVIAMSYLLDDEQQCDQIWRIFATLAKMSKSWAIFEGLFPILENFGPTLANLLHYWANFYCCKWPNIET